MRSFSFTSGLIGFFIKIGAFSIVFAFVLGGLFFLSADEASAEVTLEQDAKIQAGDKASGDHFGISVAIDGDYAIVGAYEEDTGGSNAGSAYIFTKSGSSWSQQAKIQGSDINGDDDFGYSVAIDGNTVIVGAPEKDGARGYAYIFTLSLIHISEPTRPY